MDDIEGLLELDEEKDVMIITDENEMGQVRPLTRQLLYNSTVLEVASCFDYRKKRQMGSIPNLIVEVAYTDLSFFTAEGNDHPNLAVNKILFFYCSLFRKVTIATNGSKR